MDELNCVGQSGGSTKIQELKDLYNYRNQIETIHANTRDDKLINILDKD